MRADPAPVLRDEDFNNSKQALKNRKRAVKPTDVSESAAHKQLKISWQQGDNFHKRVSRMVNGARRLDI